MTNINNLTPIFLSIVALFLSGYLGYLGGKQALKTVLFKFNLLEEELNELSERFKRRQNRENMRDARDAKETNESLVMRAQRELGTENNLKPVPTSTAAEKKAAIRRNMRGS